MGKEKENTQESGEETKTTTPPPPPPGKGMSLVDLILRIVAAVSTMGSAVAVATTSRSSLPSFTNFMHFNSRQYQDFPTFTFFVVSNGIASAYLVLSLALSVFHIFKTGAKITRAVLVILDTTILSLLTAGASAAAAIAYVAHKGSEEAKWGGICERYNSLCERVSGALVGSFMAILALMLLVFLSAISLSRK